MSKREDPKIPEDLQKFALKILEDIEREDEYTRQRMLRECKQYELYWHGFQFVFWDERVQDFRIPTQDFVDQVSTREEVKFIYDYVVNIFKAHGLSIIAALSAEVPSVSFSPMDASESKDLNAARKAEILGKIIQKDNRAKLIFYHALFTLYTNHFVAAYNYYERDEKYGTVEIPRFKKEKQKVGEDSWKCESCGYTGDHELIDCPDCSGELTQVPGEEKDIPTQVGVDIKDKGMSRIIIKGTLNVKIPTYAADQTACGYLIDYSDQHYAWLRNQFRHLDRSKIGPQSSDNFERIARMPSIGSTYSDTYMNSLVTFKRVWLRPWMYDILDKNSADEFQEKFPKGCYFSVIEGCTELAEMRQERLDDHWTITKGDLSRTIHGDPLGKPLMPMQDLENTTVNLMSESLEHSIPTSFADPEILDFDLYSKQEVSPGSIYPIKQSINPQKRIEDYFYTLKTSTLPREAVDFDKIIESKGQFVVGAFPSIFGGPQTQGSKTLGEYQESRSYALQRLSIPYQILFFWWSDIIHKSVKDYIKNMITDEKHSIKVQDSKYESIQLLMDDFKLGRFGILIPEGTVDLPVSYSQKRSTIEQMIQLNSDILNQFLFSPENRKVTLRYLGVEELSDLDTNQTMKQLMEIDELLNNEAIQPQMPAMGMPPEQMGQAPIQEVSSVPIEPEVDDDEIHLRVIKTFASSEIGQAHKKNNPGGYKNMLLHAREHQNNLMMQQMQEIAAQKPTSQAPQGEEQNA